jgi:hypothetical protein
MLVGIQSPRMGATYCICGDRNTHSPLPVKEGTKQPTNPAEATILWTGSSWHEAPTHIITDGWGSGTQNGSVSPWHLAHAVIMNKLWAYVDYQVSGIVELPQLLLRRQNAVVRQMPSVGRLPQFR